MLEICPVSNRAEFTSFVDFPFQLHRSHPLWIPPIKSQELNLLSATDHPFWQTAQRKLFLARRGGVIVGRIAAIHDAKYNSYAGEQCGAFGFFECAEDSEAAYGLLDASRGWLNERGLNFMRGPLNPSTNYTCGLLVDGFDKRPALMMPWNPPYYANMLEAWGLRKEEDLFAWVIHRRNLTLPEQLQNEIARLKETSGFSCRPASKETMEQDIRAMLEIYRISWAQNWGFSPLSQGEAEEHVRELRKVIDPDYFVMFYHQGKPVAGMVALPDLSPLLKKLNGKIGLSAPFHYFFSRKEISHGLRIMLFGILPEYRLHGLPLLLLDYIMNRASHAPDLEWVEGSWILERNYAMNELMEDFSGELAKRYRIYRREIGTCQTGLPNQGFW